MVESSGPEAVQAGPLPLEHPFVKAVSRLDLESIGEMLTADPGLVDADLHGRAWIGGPRRTAAGWERAPEQTSRAVHLAAYGHAGLLRLLIAHGADPDRLGKSRGGTTTLQSLVAPDGVEARELARNGEHIPAMELLLDHGAGVNTLSAEGMTALDCAEEIGSGPVADFLRQRGGRRARDLDTHQGEPWTTS